MYEIAQNKRLCKMYFLRKHFISILHSFGNNIFKQL